MRTVNSEVAPTTWKVEKERAIIAFGPLKFLASRREILEFARQLVDVAEQLSETTTTPADLARGQ